MEGMLLAVGPCRDDGKDNLPQKLNCTTELRLWFYIVLYLFGH